MVYLSKTGRPVNRWRGSRLAREGPGAEEFRNRVTLHGPTRGEGCRWLGLREVTGCIEGTGSVSDDFDFVHLEPEGGDT